jgi:hypothetical protein
MSSQRCSEIRELLPELALGILGGEDRARALDHIAGCGTCEASLADYSRVADDVLLLTPQQEPPIGFEERVIQRLRRDRPAPRARKVAALLAAAAVLAALGAGGVFIATRNDRMLANGYVRALREAGGTEFRAAKLLTTEGNNVGQVFAYEGNPSWVYVIVKAPASETRYRITGFDQSGGSVDLGRMTLADTQADWARTTTMKLSHLRLVRLISEDGRIVLEAKFPRD